jgi:hypothetical protein
MFGFKTKVYFDGMRMYSVTFHKDDGFGNKHSTIDIWDKGLRKVIRKSRSFLRDFRYESATIIDKATGELLAEIKVEES